MSVDIATYVHDLAVEAKAASGALATAMYDIDTVT